MNDEIDMILGGAQGAGLETTVQILSSAFASSGLGILADREYYSNIKGRHSYVHAKVSSTEIPRSLESSIDILGCMDAETVFTHFEDVREEGYIIYDSSVDDKTQDEIKSLEDPLRERLEDRFDELGVEGTVSSILDHLEEEKDVEAVELDFPSILKELQEKYEMSSSQASRYVSSILIGAVSGLMDLEKNSIEKGIEKKFEGKEKIAEQNMFLVGDVTDMVKEEHGSPLKMEKLGLDEDQLLMVNGNEITGMGKMTAGLGFQSYYPITPAADESLFIEKHAGEENVLVVQTEDELAAVTSCIGAALTGTRSATATSGPGFDLMTEGLGWAGINEVPMVITYYQRGGPSTGLPTRGSQDDLMTALQSSHGSSPRIVLASGDHHEAFRDAVKAFNLAEKYQTPVIHLLDKFLANMVRTVPLPEIESLTIERGELWEGGEDYRRFEDGPISERAFLGEEVMWYTGSEHTESGNVIEDPEKRLKMKEKRMNKLDLADKEMDEDERAIYFGPEDPEHLLLGWGSVKEVAIDSIESLEEKIGYLHLRTFSPFPEEKVLSYLKKADKVVAVEHSYSARVSEVVSLKTGFEIENEVVKYTGRPIYRDELVRSMKDVLSGRVSREVLKHGP